MLTCNKDTIKDVNKIGLKSFLLQSNTFQAVIIHNFIRQTHYQYGFDKFLLENISEYKWIHILCRTTGYEKCYHRDHMCKHSIKHISRLTGYWFSMSYEYLDAGHR